MSAKRPPDHVINRMYIQWLKGKTLRQLAQEYPIQISHSTISIWFTKVYGKGASNPKDLSLLRSLLEDNPGNPEVEAWVISNIRTRSGDTKHRSKHSMGQLSRWQVVREPKLMDYIAPVGNDPWDTLEPEPLDFLRLPLYRLLIDVIVANLMAISEDI